MTDELSNVVSLVSNIDEVALVAIETQGDSEICMPSGLVSEEVPSITVTGIDRSRYKRACPWIKKSSDLQNRRHSRCWTSYPGR